MSDPELRRAATLSPLAKRVLLTFDHIDAKTGKGNYVTLYALREALPGVPRGDFDQAVNELRIARKVSLDSADGRHVRISPAEQAAAIVEDGDRLVYMARRSSITASDIVQRVAARFIRST